MLKGCFGGGCHIAVTLWKCRSYSVIEFFRNSIRFFFHIVKIIQDSNLHLFHVEIMASKEPFSNSRPHVDLRFHQSIEIIEGFKLWMVV